MKQAMQGGVANETEIITNCQRKIFTLGPDDAVDCLGLAVASEFFLKTNRGQCGPNYLDYSNDSKMTTN